MTRFVDAGSLIADLDVAHSWINRFGVEQDGYPTGAVTAVEQMRSVDLPASGPAWTNAHGLTGMRNDPMGDYVVIPTTVTIDGVSFTVISGKLGVEVDA